MASRWEVLAQVMNDINDSDDYGVIKDLKEVLRLCHTFDDGGGEYGPGIEAHQLANAIFDVLSEDYTQSEWDEEGTGWREHNKRVKAAEAAEAAATLQPGECDPITGQYNADPNNAEARTSAATIDTDTPEDELPPLREGAR